MLSQCLAKCSICPSRNDLLFQILNSARPLIDVLDHSCAELAEIVMTFPPSGFFTATRQSRQKGAGDNGQDAQQDGQVDQGKGSSVLHDLTSVHRCWG